MVVYKLYNEESYDHPVDMKKILTYLESYGELYVNGSTVEKLWYRFSDRQYCAGWIGVNESTLSCFAEWLDGAELEELI